MGFLKVLPLYALTLLAASFAKATPIEPRDLPSVISASTAKTYLSQRESALNVPYTLSHPKLFFL